MPTEFVTFGGPHLVAAGTAIGLAVLIPLWLRRQLSEEKRQPAGRLLAVLLVVHEIYRLVLRTGIYDQPLIEYLPLQLCSMTLILSIVMLWRKSYAIFQVVYFWGIGGLTAALLTPDIPYSFPHPIFVMFFTGHGLVLTGVFYAILVYGFRPRFRSIGIAMAALVGYALIIFPLNLALGTNFLYLVRKPAQASPLDFLGPWPYYIAGLAVLTVVICVLSWLPFALTRRNNGQEP